MITSYISTFVYVDYLNLKYSITFLFPRWENKIDLFVRLDSYSNSFKANSKEFLPESDPPLKPTFDQSKVYIGRFQGHEYDLAASAFVFTPQNPAEIFYKPEYEGYEKFLANAAIYDQIAASNSKPYLFFILSFPKANDYLIKIPPSIQRQV